MKSWDKKLSQAKFAHNHAVNCSTCFSPFQVVYTILPRGPLDLLPFPKTAIPHRTPLDFVNGLQTIHEAVRNNLERTTRKYKGMPDKKKRHMEFNEGDLVWAVLTKERFPTGEYNKLLARELGPIKILTKINPNAYRLQLPSNIRTADVFNFKQLFLYYGEDSIKGNSRGNSVPPKENDEVATTTRS